MAKSKRRYNSKKIARTPSLKRDLAKFIAAFSTEEKLKVPTLVDMIAFGHRGLISYDESELCKKFDQLYENKIKQIEDKKERLRDLHKEPSTKLWMVERMQEEIKILDQELKPYEEMASAIFEDKVLK
jgi:hypothetical protein